MAEIIYSEGKDRFGLEKEAGEDKGKKKGGPSRREKQLAKLRGEKKKLRTRWLQANESEKQGSKVIYEDIKAKHRKLTRDGQIDAKR